MPPRRVRFAVSCAHCGATMTRTQWRLTHTKHHFCNRACKHMFQANHPLPKRERQVQTACDYCGKTFMRKQCRVRDNHVYCDWRCAARGLSAQRRSMQDPTRTDEHIYWYGPNWRKQRRKARERDGYRCQACGMSEKRNGQHLDVHHIIPFRAFSIERCEEANQLENLICLCKSCHSSAEHGTIPLQPKLL